MHWQQTTDGEFWVGIGRYAQLEVTRGRVNWEASVFAQGRSIAKDYDCLSLEAAQARALALYVEALRAELARVVAQEGQE